MKEPKFWWKYFDNSKIFYITLRKQPRRFFIAIKRPLRRKDYTIYCIRFLIFTYYLEIRHNDK